MNMGILPCPIEGCNRSFKNQLSLSRHLELIHSEFKKFECEWCHKALSSMQNLREHTYTHTGEKPYICSVPGCGASFRQGSQLSAHKRVHLVPVQRNDLEFRELKVSIRQLTDLLKSFKEEKPCFQLEQASPIELPPITHQRQGPVTSITDFNF